MKNVTLTDRHVLVLITGIPGAGKSSVAERLARRFERGVHLRGDVFRRMIVSGRAELTADPSEEAWRQLRLRHALGAAAADGYFNAGFSVVLQDVVIGPALQRYVDMVRSRPLCVVVLTPTADVVARREASRSKNAYRPGFAGIETLDNALRHETPRIGLWVDTSEQTPDETVDEIVTRVWNDGQLR